MFRQIGPPEIILILVVLVLLFGAKRLPDAARSLGRSMRIFKSEVKEMGKDDEETPPTTVVTREIQGHVAPSPPPAPSSRPVAEPQPTQQTQQPSPRHDA